MNETSRQWLHDALQSARLVRDRVQRITPENYFDDEWFRSAVERRLEIIGEALNRVRRIEPGVEDRFPKIHEWIAQRNVLAHLYDQIDDMLVWRVVTDELPELITTLEALVALAELDEANDRTVRNQPGRDC